jgi:uncharacterized protein (DUF1697 family)
MQRYIAFLSGLPVGRNKVPMSTLENLFRKLGFLNVESYLTTGNIAFDTAPVGITAPLEAQISRHLERSIDGDIRTFLRTPEELFSIASEIPFTESEMPGDSALFIVLLAEPLDDRTEYQLRIRRNDNDLLKPRGREIYWLRRRTDDASSKPLSLTETLNVPATVRSLNTIKKLADRRRSPRTTASARSRQ